MEPVKLTPLCRAKDTFLFRLQDAIHEFRRFASSTSMNQQLALETLLLGEGRGGIRGLRL
jgi:hypothetical protein